MRCPTVLAALTLCLASTSVPRAEARCSHEPERLGTSRQDSEPAVFREVTNWLRAFRRGSLDVREGTTDLGQLESLVAALRTLRLGRPETAREVDLALLDLAGLGLREDFPLPRLTRENLAERGINLEEAAVRVRGIGRRALQPGSAHTWSEEQLHWLARDVLLLRSQHSDTRRLVAMDILRERRSADGLLAILTVARDPRDDLRDEAVEAMIGWPDRIADTYLFERFDARETDELESAFRQLSRHLAARAEPLPKDAHNDLRRRISELLVSPDWREATRGIELSRSLPPDLVAVPLLGGMETWCQRVGVVPGTGGRRVTTEILAELRSMSGLGIPLDPAAWRTWWQRVERGEVPLKRGAVDGSSIPVTEATFFGLRPSSDQVWFVLDLSGSMLNAIGTGARGGASSRYNQAVGQLLTYLEHAGPSTRFGVTLFNGTTHRWRKTMTWATESQLRSLRSWLDEQKPAGGTLLRPAVQETLQVRRNGKLDLAALEADTIVILCDGETDAGPEWVAPFLELYRETTRIVFHGILLGHEGDGTLQALVDGTGGDLVRWN